MKTPRQNNPNMLNALHPARLALGLAVLCAQSLYAQAPLPIYEPFPASYTNTPNENNVPVPAGATTLYPARRLGNDGSFALWPIGGAVGGGSPLVVGGAATLSYPGLYQAPGSVGVFIRTNNTTATRSPGILYTTTSAGAMYASMLINVQSFPSPTDTVGPNRLFAKLDNATTGTGSGSMAGVWLTSSNTLALSKSSNTLPSADTGTALPAGTHLLVMRYTWNPGVDDDEVALWVDPPGSSFNVPEANVPSPTITTTTGADVTSLSSFYIYHIGTEVVASLFLDEIRLATIWADVTSTQALCVAASVATPPASKTVNEGIGAILSVTAGGSNPTFQWQVSTNGGTSWNNVTGGVGATSPSYVTPPLTAADSGNQYRVIVTVACNNTTATSPVATVSVVPAVVTPNGVVVDDVFQDFFYNNLPYGISNSVWFAGTASSLDASGGTGMTGYSQSGSVNWLGFFTDDSVTNLPVHLAVGKGLKGTLVFRGNNIVTNGGSLRIGYFDYADGATRPTADGFGNNTGAVNARGYMVGLNYGTNFSGNPFSLYARNNLAANDLMGTTGSFLSLGGGPGGYAGAPAFQEGVDYTLDFTIARKALNSVTVTVTATGGGTNWTHSRTDTTYAYPRFDCIAIRPASAVSTADSFVFTRFLVQVIDVPPDPIPLTVVPAAGGNVTLTWSDPRFVLQAAPEALGSFTNVPSATSPYTTSAGDARKFFRLNWTAP